MDIIKVKEFIKYSSLGGVARLLARPYFWFNYKKSDYIAWRRKNGHHKTPKYEFLKDLKNTHKNERCFIVATGPSLTLEDLNLIKDEFCFGMNSCVFAMDKSNWIPNILGIQDEFVYQKIEEALLKESKGRLKDKIIVSDNVCMANTSARQFKQFHLHYLDHKYNPKGIGTCKFSDDCYNVVYDGYSIIFSILQFAIYMGFKEIYLLGADCNYQLPKAHFVEHGAREPNSAIIGNRLIFLHSLFKNFADAHDVKVINCTRGGMLEVYPRMKLEDVLVRKYET